MGWLLLVYRLAGDGSRHRVAVWRELRRVGAVALQQATWALPATPAHRDALVRALALVERAGGQAWQFELTPGEPEAARLEAAFTAAREEEWAEFLAECDKYDTEIAREISTAKFTLAELDEEEHSLDRLRRWHRELRGRDLYGAPSAPAADRRLKECDEALEGYAEQVLDARLRPEPGSGPAQ